MKGLLFVLVTLAATKVGTQEYIRRQSAYDTIMMAYREHAIAGCRYRAFEMLKLPAHAAAKSYKAWSQPTEIELTIGRNELEVSLWQTTNVLWSKRFRDPFIFVTFDTQPARFLCVYDIKRATATVEQVPTNTR